MSSSAIPPSFNPHAVHPFTSGAPSARTPSASIPIPSPHTTSLPRPAATSISPQGAQSRANLFAMQAPTTTRPTAPTQQPAQPIFTPFRPERSSSPELLLRKKSPSAWPAQPSYPSQKAPAKK